MELTSFVIKHSEITDEMLTEICLLKAVRWHYSLKQHRDWITQNIQPNDFHLLIKEDEKPIAYTNLVDITAKINNENITVRGIGNVCTSETGKGFGNILMNHVNEVLNNKSWIGILLCKDHLVSYYEKFDWKVVSSTLIKTDKFSNVNFMIYNFNVEIESLEYNDRNF